MIAREACPSRSQDLLMAIACLSGAITVDYHAPPQIATGPAPQIDVAYRIDLLGAAVPQVEPFVEMSGLNLSGINSVNYGITILDASYTLFPVPETLRQ